ncbi:MAG: VWA domain-containing protein [Acidobacteria bacterium]|nr:VWA domain-containing protein [Acidobacteriota bacterium]
MPRRSKTPDRPGRRPGFLASRVWSVLALLSLFFVPGFTPPAPAQGESATDDDFRLRVETDLVVLHATITDRDSRPVADLTQESFRVFENNVEQRIKIFKREDIPVSVGILVDNSGSMREKRRGVNAAALKFVQSSNPLDEVFIVNFNEESFLDADFTDSIPLLEEALEKIDARGGTALYDAIDMSLVHMKERATLDKRVLIAITDGEDNASSSSLEQVVQWVERANVMIYTVGLLSGENGRSDRRAKRAMEEISKASGGAVFFPDDPDDVLLVASDIANDIRNQYVIAYTPTNTKKDGTFRKVEIKVNAPRRGKLTVRTRTGYRAVAQPKDAAETTDSSPL